MARKTLTDRMVAKLKPDPQRRLAIPDPECSGLFVRITPAGAKSFVAVARTPDNRQVWATLGSADHTRLAEARTLARQVIARIKAGLEPFEKPPAKPATFTNVAADWQKRHVEAKGVRTAAEIGRVLGRDILPILGTKPFVAIRRGDVTQMLDLVEDQSGARSADVALGIVRAIMNWYAARHDDYTVPVVRGMRRDANVKRSRILSDDEIRAVWGPPKVRSAR